MEGTSYTIPKITQISSCSLPEYYKNPTIIFGLGEDQNVYFWNEDTASWQLNKRQNVTENPMPYTQPWEEEFDKLTVFSAPMPKDNNVHTFVVDIQEVKDFISQLISSERAKLLKEIEEKIDESPLCLRDYNILKSRLNSMK